MTQKLNLEKTITYDAPIKEIFADYGENTNLRLQERINLEKGQGWTNDTFIFTQKNNEVYLYRTSSEEKYNIEKLLEGKLKNQIKVSELKLEKHDNNYGKIIIPLTEKGVRVNSKEKLNDAQKELVNILFDGNHTNLNELKVKDITIYIPTEKRLKESLAGTSIVKLIGYTYGLNNNSKYVAGHVGNPN